MINNSLSLDPIKCDIQYYFKDSKDKIKIEYLSQYQLENSKGGGLYPKRVGNLIIEEHEYLNQLKDLDFTVREITLTLDLNNLREDY